ncbi:MAG TPA: glycine cleavage system aminomethyltransferase GcvT [Candidatus Saccharimonadales bacterium]|nr:glycine cleavage system aminomethyltransferase GcvT [Candidatus Saccharimonadales bacterium]
MLKRTALFSAHQRLGAKLIDFGGWEMPVQYTSIVEEHLAVRNAAGIFDISHMGEVTVSGAIAEDFLNHTLTNNIRKLASGQGQYTLLCNEHGGTIDDLYAYRLSNEVYLLIINASRIEADVAWLQEQAAKFSRQNELELTDTSHHYSAVAVQGPQVPKFIDHCISGDSNCAARVNRVTELKKNQIGGFVFRGADVLVSRTGYTGEDGFEIVGRNESIRQIWDSILDAGQAFGIKPCGLGARDTLRMEVCYPLYGHELDEGTTPIEAGLGSFVSLDKGEFVGRAVLADQKANGVGKKLIAFKMTEKSAPPRPHYPIWANGAKVGEVTSGTQSPSLGIGVGMGYVPPEITKPDTRIEIEIRGKHCPALVVKKPIYQSIKKL